ncbi:general stress protein [Aquipuribacter sp. SD81]|uniref:general stress protein n=1 Tax=Aquipuribacter sp. SD81 TaxID=3127703 RepID=UPI0030175309
MAFGPGARGGGVPRLPTPFHGERIATYDTYEQAQRAVDYLSDEKFPVQKVAIIGTDLRMVERVTGRLNYPRVAGAGAASGAYFGSFVGLLLLLFGSGGIDVLLAAALIGAGFGMLFGVISFSFTGGRRDFTSASQIVASQYQVVAVADVANQARNVLRNLPNSGVDAGPAGFGGQQPPSQPSQPSSRPPASQQPGPGAEDPYRTPPQDPRG